MTFRDAVGAIGLDELQRKIGEWADVTFPHHTAGTIVDHINEEATELQAAYLEWGAKPRSVDEEAADIAILILTLAHVHRFSFAEAIAAKHSINTRREWGEPNRAGVVHHVGHDPRA